MTSLYFIKLAPSIMSMMQGKDRSTVFSAFRLTYFDASGYDLSSTASVFIHSVPFEERPVVANSLNEDPRFWWLTMLLCGFELSFLADSQRLSVRSARKLADSEILILKSL